ncbi:MAG: hypothetical protein AAF609_25865 [Cyanobacteria bacterium P01_C01_bin.120]
MSRKNSASRQIAFKFLAVSGLAVTLWAVNLDIYIYYKMPSEADSPKKRCACFELNLDSTLVEATDQVFHNKHPELLGKPIPEKESQLAEEWLAIREHIKDCRMHQHIDF